MWYVDFYTVKGRNEICSFKPFEEFSKDFNINGVKGRISSVCKGKDYVVDVFSDEGKEFYFSVRYEGDGEFHTFSGKSVTERYIRQSPRDITDYVLDMEKEAIPMASVFKDGAYTVAISDNPSNYENGTTQHIYKDGFCVSSGDRGSIEGEKGKHFEPLYHNAPHAFKVMITSFEAEGINAFRNKIFEAVDRVWGEGGSVFHAVCFASNYMHFRKNETGYSKSWIVPGIDYANYQYPRDAFWQSFILPAEMAEQCYMATYPERFKYAENALFYLIWSYRIHKAGGKADMERVREALDFIDEKCTDGCYMPSDSKLDFKSWYDICAFEKDDVISYNQGLLAVAMRCAKELGELPVVDINSAAENYRALFNGRFIPLSRKKQFISLDVFAGDVLNFILFDEFLLTDDIVRSCYSYVVKNSKTPYGCKVVCAENGDFLDMEDHGACGYISPHQLNLKPGEYAYGGSYYLYEMLFHIGAYLHNAEGAEDNLIERSKLDFDIGGTYYEHINTVTGVGNKPNQGWNASIYSLWSLIMDKGLADSRFFDEMDKVIREL